MILDPATNTFTVLTVSQSATANFNSAVVDVSGYVGRVGVILNAQAVSGTNPTLDIRVMSGSESNGANATNANVNFTQVTTTNSHQTVYVDTRSIGQYLKCAAVIGGTNTPTFIPALTLVGQKRSS